MEPLPEAGGGCPRERGPLQLMPDCLLLDSKCATQVQLRIYLYSKNEKATPRRTPAGRYRADGGCHPLRRAGR